MTGDGRWIVSDDHGGGFSDGGVRTNRTAAEILHYSLPKVSAATPSKSGTQLSAKAWRIKEIGSLTAVVFSFFSLFLYLANFFRHW